MYLNKKWYNWRKENNNFKITGIKGLDISKVKTISQQAIYWRKANAIHNWFVENIQEGNDDCKNYELEEKDLIKLLETINKVLENKELAEELLPSKTGFFFGDTEYDKYYFEDLQYTKTEITNLLKEDNKDWYFEYTASW